MLCILVKASRKAKDRDVTEKSEVFVRFVFSDHWFTLWRTEDREVPPMSASPWDVARALAVLNAQELSFDLLDGNVLGYARDRTIAINPVNPLPNKTRFHELAHILLGHTSEAAQHDDELTPRNLRECEAEAVALLCCSALDLPGIECSRGYIQGWWGQGNPIPERSAQRVLKVADQILRAGTNNMQRRS
jgi:hypothetical protein